MAAVSDPFIAREGWALLVAALAAAVVLYVLYGPGGSAPAWLLLVGLLILFRDPTRVPPSLPLALVSAANGKVVQVGTHTDPWLEREALVVVVRMSLFDVHSIYCPIEGKLVGHWSTGRRGAPPRAAAGGAVAFSIRTDEGDDITVAVARGFWRGPVSFSYGPGERVGHGRRIGFAMLGSIISIYAAANTLPKVSLGQRVVAGSTVIASLVHQQAVSAIPPEPA